MEHFGVRLYSRGKSYRLNRDEFALIDTKPSISCVASLVRRNAYSNDKGKEYTEEWCNEYREICLKNYDLNMEYFSVLDQATFNSCVNRFISKYNRFVEIKNLNDYAGVEGYYLMVLDQYKQVYIGKTEDIKRRIMQHWSNTKPFDRTLYPMYAWDKSCFSIDFFRALDTTRIFVWNKKITIGIEEQLINDFPVQFTTNRIGGDISNAILAIASTKKRQFM